MVRDDCTQRMDEVVRAMPTIVFTAKDATGQDVVDVKVTVDGKPFADRLDGTALPASPGVHKFVFHFAAGADVERSFVLSEGVKDRHEAIVAPVAAPSPTLTTPPPVATPAPVLPEPSAPVGSPGAEQLPPTGMSKQRLIGWAVGGTGVAGVLASWGISKSSCAGSSTQECPNHAQAVSQHDTAVTDATVSTIAFGVGVAGLAAGAVLLLTAPREASTTALDVTPLVGPSAGGFLVRGAF